MIDNFSDTNPNLENVDYKVNEMYENRSLRKEKIGCLFCGKKAVKVVRNINSDHSQPFVSIRHCNSDECRKLAAMTCNEWLMNPVA